MAGRRKRLGPLAGAAALLLAGAGAAQAQSRDYDAFVGWLQAGAIDIRLQRNGSDYELSGSVEARGAIARLVRWRGRFAAIGAFDGDYPRTRTYLLLEEDGDTREVLLATGGRTVVHATDKDSEELEQPAGSDIMSVLFLAPHCIDDATVHDGEDAYLVRLRRAGAVRVEQRPPYYRGDATRCDYDFRYLDGSIRRVSVWLADVEGQPWPVRVRVRVPLRPDGHLRLRLPAATDEPALAGP